MITKYCPDIDYNLYLRDEVATDLQVFEDVCVHKYHVPNLPEPPKTVLDLGAYIGLTTRYYEKLWPNAQVIGFEMNAANFFFSINNTYCLRNEAITTQERIEKDLVWYDGKDAQSYSIKPREETRGDCAIGITLDQAISCLHSPDGIADFVKMDIEGEELKVLSSPGAWKDRIRNLLVEVHGDPISQREANIDLVITCLEARGFIVTRHGVHWSALFATKEL